jgi:hypothetical protein
VCFNVATLFHGWYAEETAEILTAPAEATEAQSETPELKSAPLTYEKPRILLMDLKGKHLTPESRESIYDLLATHLSAHEDFDVITSQDLRQMATLEADKQKAGCEDESCIAEMAGAMGARYVVYGNVGVLGKKNMLTLNLFDSVDAKPIPHKPISPPFCKGCHPIRGNIMKIALCEGIPFFRLKFGGCKVHFRSFAEGG